MYTGPQIITDGLVLYVDAANPKSYLGSGTNIYNLAGTTSGTLNNGTGHLSNNKGVWDFDGTNDNMTISSGYSFTSGDDYTYEVWFNPTTNNTTSGLIGGPNNPMIRWGQGIPGTVYFFCGWSESPFYKGVRGNSILNVGEWHHAVGTLDRVNQEGKLYINGEYDSQLTWSTGTISSPSSTVMFNQRDSSNAYQGKISIGKLYNRVLTPEEVLQNYNALKQRFK